MKNAINNQFKMNPGSKEVDTHGTFKNDAAVENMGAPNNYGSPMNTNDPDRDDFDYTPSTPGAGVTGTMVTETVGKGTGKSIYEKGKKGGDFEPKKAGDKLAGGGKVLSTSEDGKRQKVRTIKFS